jgi:hypothetical protein
MDLSSLQDRSKGSNQDMVAVLATATAVPHTREEREIHQLLAGTVSGMAQAEQAHT